MKWYHLFIPDIKLINLFNLRFLMSRLSNQFNLKKADVNIANTSKSGLAAVHSFIIAVFLKVKEQKTAWQE